MWRCRARIPGGEGEADNRDLSGLQNLGRLLHGLPFASVREPEPLGKLPQEKADE